MSETKKKIKVTVKKHLPCPQCGKGNMFDYYNYPDEDDVCSDCDINYHFKPITNVSFDKDKLDKVLYEQGLDWTFDRPVDEDLFSVVYIVHGEEKTIYKVASAEMAQCDVSYFDTLDEAKRECDRHPDLDYGNIMLCTEKPNEDIIEVGYWGQFSCGAF